MGSVAYDVSGNRPNCTISADLGPKCSVTLRTEKDLENSTRKS